MKAHRSLERGRWIASLLDGAWRATPPPLMLAPAQLNNLVPQLIRSGAGGLAWWKARGFDPQEVPAVSTLAECYQVHRLEAFMQEVRLQEAVETLRHYDGIEPLLAKGWAVARLYPEPGLRPYGDFDLHIAASRLRRALYTERFPHLAPWIDLHQDLPDLPDRHYAEAFRRSQQMLLRTTMIRVLGPEDHLRLLSLHFVRHGGWRPLWLCDIAASLESLPPGFDWDYFWSGKPRSTSWVRAVLGLAQRLLQARPPGSFVPVPAAAQQTWLETAVLRAWGTRVTGDSHTRDKQPISSHLLRPWGLWRAVRRRLPNAIEASYHLKQAAEVRPWLAWLRGRFLLARGKRYLARWIASGFAPPPHVHIHQ